MLFAETEIARVDETLFSRRRPGHWQRYYSPNIREGLNVVNIWPNGDIMLFMSGLE